MSEQIKQTVAGDVLGGAEQIKDTAVAYDDEHSRVESSYGRQARADTARFVDPNVEYYRPWVASYPEGVPDTIDPAPYRNIPEMFARAVECYGNRTAFCNLEASMSFVELDELSDDFAAFLQIRLRLGKGDKLAIMLPNLMQFPVVFFGALKAGVTVININPLYTPHELEQVLENSEATAMVILSGVAHKLSQIIDKTRIRHVIVSSVGDCLGFFKGLAVDTYMHFKRLIPPYSFKESMSLRAAMGRGHRLVSGFEKPDIAYDDIALLQYTGGTTGSSKGAMLSHGNLIANVAQAMAIYGSQLRSGRETIMTVIPLYHIFALTINMLLMIECGASNILITDPRNVKSMADTIRKHPEISVLTGVNTLFNLFVSSKEFSDISWSNLHIVIGGGSALQSGVEQRFFEKTGRHILEGYGLTECSPLCSVCPHTTDRFTGSIGLPVPGTIVRIVDSEGNEIRDLERAGELEIKGPQVMHGYYKCDPVQNEYVFDDGFLRTGDIAKWMEGGYIKLIDRLKDMILVSGFNVFPNEIEDVVSRFNRVLECGVIGVPSDKTGEAIKMFVVRKDPTLTAEEIRTYCKAYLTPYKVPHIIEFVDSLPKSGLGKVLRRKLREQEGFSGILPVRQTGYVFKPEHAGDSAYGSAVVHTDVAGGKDAAAVSGGSSDLGFAGSALEGIRHRSSGSMVLEQLLSSSGSAYAAAVHTPNIHAQNDKDRLLSEKLVRYDPDDPDSLRARFDPASLRGGDADLKEVDGSESEQRHGA